MDHTNFADSCPLWEMVTGRALGPGVGVRGCVDVPLSIFWVGISLPPPPTSIPFGIPKILLTPSDLLLHYMYIILVNQLF